MWLTEKIYMLDKRHSGLFIVLLAVSSMLMKKQHILNKVSLNRDIYKRNPCMDQLMKIFDQRLIGT